MKYTIYVTARHIALHRHASDNCPVALALHEQLPYTCLEGQATKLCVYPSALTLLDNKAWCMPVPQEVTEFVAKYDAIRTCESPLYAGIEPFSFNIDIPDMLPIDELGHL